MELPVPARQRACWLCWRQIRIRAHHRIVKGWHTDGEAIVADARLAVIAVPHFEIETILFRVLHAQYSAPVRRAITAVSIRRDLREGHGGCVGGEGVPIDLHFGPMVGPPPPALVPAARTLRIRFGGGDDVGGACLAGVGRGGGLVCP